MASHTSLTEDPGLYGADEIKSYTEILEMEEEAGLMYISKCKKNSLKEKHATEFSGKKDPITKISEMDKVIADFVDKFGKCESGKGEFGQTATRLIGNPFGKSGKAAKLARFRVRFPEEAAAIRKHKRLQKKQKAKQEQQQLLQGVLVPLGDYDDDDDDDSDDDSNSNNRSNEDEPEKPTVALAKRAHSERRNPNLAGIFLAEATDQPFLDTVSSAENSQAEDDEIGVVLHQQQNRIKELEQQLASVRGEKAATERQLKHEQDKVKSLHDESKQLEQQQRDAQAKWLNEKALVNNEVELLVRALQKKVRASASAIDESCSKGTLHPVLEYLLDGLEEDGRAIDQLLIAGGQKLDSLLAKTKDVDPHLLSLQAQHAGYTDENIEVQQLLDQTHKLLYKVHSSLPSARIDADIVGKLMEMLSVDDRYEMLHNLACIAKRESCVDLADRLALTVDKRVRMFTHMYQFKSFVNKTHSGTKFVKAYVQVLQILEELKSTTESKECGNLLQKLANYAADEAYHWELEGGHYLALLAPSSSLYLFATDPAFEAYRTGGSFREVKAFALAQLISKMQNDIAADTDPFDNEETTSENGDSSSSTQDEDTSSEND